MITCTFKTIRNIANTINNRQNNITRNLTIITYNKISKQPKVEGTCDRCGGHEFYQREDDKPEVVKNRLEVNEKMNAPLKDFYQKKGLLTVINGEQTPEKVFEDIDAVLSNNQ